MHRWSPGVRFAAFFGVAGLILWLSLTPAPPQMPSGLLSWDKFQHALAYATLTLVAGGAFVPLSRTSGRGWTLAVAFAVSYGALLEVLQGLLTTTRSADPRDLLADAVGAALLYAAVRIAARSGLRQRGRG